MGMRGCGVGLSIAAALAAAGCAQAPAGGAPAAADPTIAAVVADISAARIEARIRRLAAFGTRHTLSDTASPTRGIGAARRWIEQELRDCSAAAGGRLQVEADRHVLPPGPRVPAGVELVNVVATLPGTDPASRARHFVVSGHYDSRAGDVMDATSDAPGANDDASGTAAVMELACVMARHRFDATLVFLAVAGEEQGLLGAEAWAVRAQREGLRIDGMVTNDIVGSPVGDDGRREPRRVRLFADGLGAELRRTLAAAHAVPADPAASAAAEAARRRFEATVRTGGMADFGANQLGRYLKEAGERWLPGFEVTLVQRADRFLRGGDHLPFLERGVAAVRFTEPREDFAHQHQDLRSEGGRAWGDLPEFVDFSYVADVARVNAAGLASLALAPAAPRNLVVETSALTNDTTLRWDDGSESDLAGWRVRWRPSGSPVWQGQRDVGRVTRVTLAGLSKDDLVFGVQALDRDGHASLASYPLPAGR